MSFVHFRDAPTGRLVRIPLVNGRVEVAKVRRYFGASDVSFMADGVECFLEEGESGLSLDSFVENTTLDIFCQKESPKDRGECDYFDADGALDTAGSALLGTETARYFSRFSNIPSPSALAKNMNDYHLGDKPAYKKYQFQTPDKEVFLNYRPDTVCGAPISLACPIFGKFRDAFKESKVSRRSCEFVWELCGKASQFYRDEDKRLQVMRELLAAYLPPGFSFVVAVPGQSDSDIYILYGDQVVCILEGKPEPGFNGDSQMQISGYYQQLCDTARKEPSAIFLSTSFPVLTIELVGPLLRIGGAVFIGAPVLEPLSPMMHLFRIKDADHMNQLVRVCHAMREALIELADFYSTAAASCSLVKRNVARLSLPYPMQRWDAEGARFKQADYGKSTSREVYAYVVDLEGWVGADSLLESLVSKGHKKAFFKVCQGYGSDVHRAWYEKGSAPELFGEHRLHGGWSIVVMEFKEGWKTLFDVRQWAKREVWRGICDKARECLQRAQEAPLRGVHGDLRLPNILVSPDFSQVCFVDLGWAGVEGQGLYPNYMNHCDITWPAGAAEGEPMKQTHDVELLEKELTKNPKATTFNWRFNDQIDH